MARQLDPEIVRVLKEHGFGKEAVWDCHGTWVIYHGALERIAAKTGIQYDTPQVLVADKDSAAILVTGRLGGKAEWSIGEASIGLNYKVSGKQAAYPFAMAEKRAKDRVILKLIGLHGLAYSEEEADDFRRPKQPEAPSPSGKDAYKQLVRSIIDASTNASDLGNWWNSEDEKSARRKGGLDETEIEELKQLVIAKRDALTGKKAA
jgi:hypothetical protein